VKRWVPFAIVCLLALGALVLSQKREATAEVGPYAILHFIADSEREAGRLPFRLTRLSDEEEIEIGNQMAGRMMPSRAEPPALTVEQYVDRIGIIVSGRAHRQIPYHFHYIADPRFVNAFALPGGHVYIGQGLLMLMDTEDQLAAVLGHEVAHIDRYHCAERVQAQAQARKLNLGIAGAVLQIPLIVFQAGYSKNQELEADSVGLDLAVSANYSPQGMIRLFEKLEALAGPNRGRADSPQEEAARVVLQTAGGYFRSHPYPEERVAEMRRIVARRGWENRIAERPLAVWRYLHPGREGQPETAR